jgi:cytoskeletal protein RodZ
LKKLSVTLAVVVAILLTSVTTLAYRQSFNQSQSNHEKNIPSVPTLSPTPTPTLTPNPTPTTTPQPEPAAEGSFGPQGYFRIISPATNTIYDSNNLTLTITGEAINQPLTMAYKIDGQERVPFSAVVRQEHAWDIFVGQIHESMSLPPLTSGTHSITVFGTLSSNSAQATVHFTVK